MVAGGARAVRAAPFYRLELVEAFSGPTAPRRRARGSQASALNWRGRKRSPAWLRYYNRSFTGPRRRAAGTLVCYYTLAAQEINRVIIDSRLHTEAERPYRVATAL